MSKRNISSILNDNNEIHSPKSKLPRTDLQPDTSSSHAQGHSSLPAKPPMSESMPRFTSLKYPVLHGPPVKPPPFQQPTPLTSFSYTPEHVQEFTDSALRYFAPIPPSLLGNPRGGPSHGLDLGYGYERWVRKPEDRGRIDSLLNAVNKVCERGTGNGEGKLMRLKDVSLVAWRGVITRIMTAPYEERDSWEMNVMVMDGTMYLEEHLTDDKLHEKNNVEERHRRAMYYGYAFESYSTWETPFNDNPAPNKWGGDVDTNVQWCSVVRTKLGDMRMVIGGEVDCVRGKYSGRTDGFIELKTSLTIRGPSDEAKFEKKLLKFYFQSFLLGVPEIVVGFRTPRGQLTSTKGYKTIEIPRMVRGKPGGWDPSVCLDWGYRFLRKLKETCEPGGVWRVKFVPGDGVRITQLDRDGEAEVINGEDRYGFLPRSYCR